MRGEDRNIVEVVAAIKFLQVKIIGNKACNSFHFL